MILRLVETWLRAGPPHTPQVKTKYWQEKLDFWDLHFNANFFPPIFFVHFTAHFRQYVGTILACFSIRQHLLNYSSQLESCRYFLAKRIFEAFVLVPEYLDSILSFKLSEKDASKMRAKPPFFSVL